jgi:ElaB/YqjD/DUF883 family membrane-anchored ribosome-binding protein
MPSTPSTTATETTTRNRDNDATTHSDGNEGGVQATASRVAHEAPAQAARVVGDARTQLTGAAQRTLSDLRSQADDRASQASRSLRGLSSNVDALVNGRPEEAGNLADVAKAIGQHASDFADRLDTSGVQGVADDLSRFGRQHPWAFLGLSLGAGFLVGRLTRATAAVVGDGQQSRTQLPTTGVATLDTPPVVPSISSPASGLSTSGLSTSGLGQ